MPDWGEMSLASKHLSVCLKNFFFQSFCKASHLPGGSTEKQQSTSLCQLCRNKKKRKTSKLSALKTHLGHKWAFYDTSILSIFFLAKCCALYSVRKRGGEWRHWESQRSRRLFRWDERETRALEGTGNVLSRAEQQLAFLRGHPQG